MLRYLLVTLLLLPFSAWGANAVHESTTIGTLATTGTTVTGNFAATVDADDLLVELFFQKGESGSSAGTFTTPTSHTAGPTNAADWNGHYAAFYKTADGSEDGGTFSSTTSRTITSNTANSISMRFSSTAGVESFASAAAVGAVASNSYAGPSLTPGEDNTLVVSVLAMAWDGSTPSITQPSGFGTPTVVPASPGFNVLFAVATVQQTTATAVTTPTWTGLPDAYGAASITFAVSESASGSSVIPVLHHQLRNQ